MSDLDRIVPAPTTLDATGDEPKPARRKRNPELTKHDILAAAREEFVEYGLNGARVDRIASRAGANKRLLYHYVGNKEALYAKVLLETYREIRRGEQALNLTAMNPKEAMAELVGFTFDHFRQNPYFIRLLAVENIHRANFLKQIKEIPELHSPIQSEIGRVLAAGEQAGDFRQGVDPVQLYITIAGISYFYFSNINTLSVIFDQPLSHPDAMAARRAHAVAVVLGYLRP